ncbi:LEAF RUST 10 DISEASE-RESISTANCEUS RECEPTOR-LIKE PROTEIN KINASE-like 2.1 [Elaeis guineensis]|uniref:LEAF RUST 10 DISEASE-RESISTANCE LOCUS RECEPTOR-LIKE PROTEIN KINASE-like 2.1 n=1 Tax=Elaeis guineensis var. tenera TaxID=51953 RepID=A0A6I9R9V2_ELAGV|nr:LEAF RUST 10 DISEASE-RESISTANCE LOCUS RECEPTOR-LIKE PROTEIN KINASE-like 2.1 [Elaeis guineensis]
MPCRIPSSPPPFLIALVFLLSLLISTNAYLVNGPPTQFCPKSICGKNVITYPFWLAQNLSTIPSTYCGYPGFALICQDDIPILSLGSNNYTVTNIDYQKQTISLADTDVLAAGTCPRPRHNLTLMDTLFLSNSAYSSYLNYNPYINYLNYHPNLNYLNYTSLDTNLTFFLDCSDGPSERRVTCFSESVGKESYVFTERDFSDIKEYEGVQQCQDIVVVPVLHQEVNWGNLSALSSDFGRVLKKGFQLGWSDKTSAECDPCELSGGRCGYQFTQASFVFACFCSNRVSHQHCGTHNSKKTRIMIGVFTASAGLSLGCLILLVHLLRHIKSHSKNVHGVEDLLHKYGSSVPKRYKYSEIKSMTKSFSHKLGHGGCGNVFKGNLYDGRPIAVKVLSESKGNGEEFVNEVASIGRTSHVNIVCLLGFCLEGSKRALVYEFMPNGSLEKYKYTDIVDAKIKLGWEKLYEITVGIARGLEYLHRGCNTRIVHFDIKPHNILLDQNFCPKIADFGLAKLCLSKESIISIAGARGTIGYIAPEVFSRNFGVVSSKSDVYSYGMMVLEMVGARKNIDAREENTSEIYFPDWIYDHLHQYDTLEACGVTGKTEEFAKKMIIVGLWCIQIRPADRPSMNRVVDMLEGSISDLQLPSKP